jgi:glutathione S-transferase
MAAANGAPVLWQFRASHFNEKARWALDWKGVRYERRSLLPGPHVPVVLWLTGQKSVPVLQMNGDTIPDSTHIIAALESRFPERPLYPADPATRARALELEEYFDEEIGPHVRRCIFHVALDEPDFIMGLFAIGSPIARTLYRAAFPLTRAVMRIDMKITDDGAARSLVRLAAALDRLAREIGPSGHLAGEAFTVADLTAAALLSPLTLPAEYPYPIPPLPEPVRAFQARFVGHPAFSWARDVYARFRGTTTGVDV